MFCSIYFNKCTWFLARTSHPFTGRPQACTALIECKAEVDAQTNTGRIYVKRWGMTRASARFCMILLDANMLDQLHQVAPSCAMLCHVVLRFWGVSALMVAVIFSRLDACISKVSFDWLLLIPSTTHEVARLLVNAKADQSLPMTADSSFFADSVWKSSTHLKEASIHFLCRRVSFVKIKTVFPWRTWRSWRHLQKLWWHQDCRRYWRELQFHLQETNVHEFLVAFDDQTILNSLNHCSHFAGQSTNGSDASGERKARGWGNGERGIFFFQLTWQNKKQRGSYVTMMTMLSEHCCVVTFLAGDANRNRCWCWYLLVATSW